MLQSDAAGAADIPIQHWVPRIRLCFLSEDPALYAKRVADAHQSRIEAVKAMRYHLCVDSMPADDMHSLSVEQINRVLTLALNSKFLRVHHAACLSSISTLPVQLTCAHTLSCRYQGSMSAHLPSQMQQTQQWPSSFALQSV